FGFVRAILQSRKRFILLKVYPLPAQLGWVSPLSDQFSVNRNICSILINYLMFTFLLYLFISAVQLVLSPKNGNWQ
ncbi:MAG: hypothetical protein ACRDC5_01780, partial [Vibrio sp.]